LFDFDKAPRRRRISAMFRSAERALRPVPIEQRLHLPEWQWAMNVRLITPLAGLGLAIALFLPSSAEAGEGGFSNYFAGAYGSILPAVAPEPGFTFVSQNYFGCGSSETTGPD
jgi:hypothetical protein